MTATTATKEIAGGIVLDNRSDLDSAMKQMSELRAEIDKYEAQVAVELGKLTRRFQPLLDGRKKKYADLEEAAVIYATDHKEEILDGQKGKTAKLKYGEIKYSQSKDKVELTGEEDVVCDRLKRAGFEDCTRIKVSIDKQAIAKNPKIADAIEGLEIIPGEETVKVVPIAAAA